MPNVVSAVFYTQYIIDTETMQIICADNNFEKITGYTQQDIDKGLNLKDLIFEEDWDEYNNTIQKEAETKNVVYLEHCIKRKNNTSIIVFCIGERFANEKNGRMETRIIITDVTGSNFISVVRKHDAKMKELNSLDKLTGLYNRGYFENLVKQRLENDLESMCAMSTIDIDNFKELNDRLGRQNGDYILKRIAEEIRVTVKAEKIDEKISEEHLIFARIGGDEFALFGEVVDSMENLKSSMDILRRRIEKIIIPGCEDYKLSVSIGISVAEKFKTSFTELFRQAGLALYDAKQTGKNNIKIFQEEKVHFKRIKKSLLIVDDDAEVRKYLRSLFDGECGIIEAADGREAMDIINKKGDDIVATLLDADMPGISGMEVLSFMRKNDYIDNIPVILITDGTDYTVWKTGYANGITDVITKPFEPNLVRSRVGNTMDLYYHKNNLEGLVAEQTEKINRQKYSIINTLGTVVEFRNMESGTHIMRVREFTRILLKQVAADWPEYGLDSRKIEMITEASPLHDVGKITISDTILLKPGKLTDEEFNLMKQHTVFGYNIVKQMAVIDDKDYIECCAEIARSHHEKYDGKGYPDGLKGDEIPISAQVVSVADVYDALVSERCYKKAYLKDVAFQMILDGECGQFNPKIMESFKAVKQDFEALVDNF